MSNINDALSYASLFKLLKSWRMSGTHNDTISGEFNKFDSPAQLYFRIFFDFGTGLLDTSQDLGLESQINDNVLRGRFSKDGNDSQPGRSIHNSALNYLVLNNEWERADLLRKFITLLSNISTYSPWYFQEIGGVDEALNRNEFIEQAYTIGEVKGLTIKCLPDAFDSRIGTLLDLYRAICYSWQLHKEIVPANLRRFNMYLYIFNTNIRGIHSTTMPRDLNGNQSPWDISSDDDSFYSDATIDQGRIRRGTTTVNNGETVNKPVLNTGGKYLAASKLIEFHDCEFSINSNATGYNTINNAEGFQNNYTIGITYRYATEQRYNDILSRVIGDLIMNDFAFPEGKTESVVWSKDDAASYNDVKNENMDRINNFGKPSAIPDEMLTPGSKTQLGGKIFVDQNTNSLLDPWKKLISQKVGDAMDSVNQIAGAGRSAIESWTDVNKLNQTLVGLVHRLSYGNLFTVNIGDITNTATSAIGRMNANSVANNITRNGWVRS